ncbi:MAG: AsmA family protein [Spongiibacteraceae bacterium]
MKLIKIVGWFFAVLLVLLAIAVFLVAQNINDLVKVAVEDIGSDVLKTSVSLDSANVKLFENRIQLSGLKIANPPGFSAGNVFEMSDIVVDVELASLLDNLVLVNEISIDGARISAEQKGINTNFQALMNNIDSGDKTEQVPVSSPDDEDSSTPIDILVRVDLFSFSNSSMAVTTEKWGAQEVSIPTIALRNIGGNAGLPPEQLAPAILKPLIKQLNTVLKKRVQELLEGKAKEKLKEKEDELKKKLDKELGGNADKLKSLFSN